MNIQKILEDEFQNRNNDMELCEQKPDPLIIAKKYQDEYISLICALFAYGKANLIVKFLESLDFSLLEANESVIKKKLAGHYYRFQNPEDVAQFFITMKRLKKHDSLENIFFRGYKKDNLIIDGIKELISQIYKINRYKSRGYKFLIGKTPPHRPTSPYKRLNMFLRWMVREDNLDMGLWSKIDRKDLLIPLDTHTFNISLKLGLINRTTYDLKAVQQLTKKLRSFDADDPVKYDFALYRIGQEKLLDKILEKRSE